ncbi:MAG: hypothetical protein MUQ30_06830 [Anaerolineae bacterium]|nr:hypothetical protein [Anaerolineae bacterium]
MSGSGAVTIGPRHANPADFAYDPDANTYSGQSYDAPPPSGAYFNRATQFDASIDSPSGWQAITGGVPLGYPGCTTRYD